MLLTDARLSAIRFAIVKCKVAEPTRRIHIQGQLRTEPKAHARKDSIMRECYRIWN